MTVTEKTAPSQTDTLSFEFDLQHPPEKVWRALTDPTLLADWLMEWAGRPHRPYRSVRALLRDLQDAGFIVEVEP